MGLLRELFGPGKAEIWSQLAAQVGGRFNAGGFLWGTDNVQAQSGDWIVTLDTYTVSTGKTSTTYTRMRAPFVNRDGFRFTISRSGLFTDLFKFFGMQDIEVGQPLADAGLVIQGNDEAKVRALFANPRIPPLLLAEPALRLTVLDDEGWFAAHFPEGVDELRFDVMGVITDLDRLKRLFDLYAEVLNQLAHMDSAYKEDLALHVETLLGPGGQIRSGDMILWDGNVARGRAAEALGRLRAAAGVQPLLQVLPDPDPFLRATAVWSLGEIGDRRAVRALFPLLGDAEWAAEGKAVDHYAAEALRKLGEGARVEAFARTLEGNEAALALLKEQDPDALVRALFRALKHPEPVTASYAAWALAQLSAVEALPQIRALARVHASAPSVKSRLDAAVAELERRRDLPRPAGAPAPDLASLPLTAAQPTPDPNALPIPSGEEG
jgi:HEAT repeat protein